MAEAAAYHALPPDRVLAELATSPTGLTGAEAAARLRRWGPNRLPQAHPPSLARLFLAQFASPFIYVLLTAAGVSVALGHRLDAAFILAVLLLNASLGGYQEWRSERRAHALQALLQGSAAVWRDGALVRLPAVALVPGDIVQVESGDRVRADLRLLDARLLMLDESLLTGESAAVHKRPDALLPADAPLADRVTMLYAATTVQSGRGRAAVAATGSRTEIGRLAASLQRPEPPPPLVRRINRFTRQLALGMLATLLLFAGLETARGARFGDIVLLAIALAVSAIPEGLPVAMTVALSIAARRMGMRHVIVRRLPAVEGLGACDVIATDKTGTLTLNRLSIERLWMPGHGPLPPPIGRRLGDPLSGAGTTRRQANPVHSATNGSAVRCRIELDDPAAARSLLQAGALASDPPARGPEGWGGDAVDLAFLTSAAAAGWDAAAAALITERIPYEPVRRYSAAFEKDDETGAWTAYTKGAPETVAAFCQPHPPAAAAAEEMAAAGYRVIAIAAGPVAAPTPESLRDLDLLGLVGLLDPLRPEAHDAILRAARAGLRVIMITGDHPRTALAIARQLGLATTLAEVVTGAELARSRPPSFDAWTARARVFARTEPLQKLAIVESLQRQGHTVAVTGDGINDAPALQAADIGIAMGRAGTDVARDAADLILTDDNFASIVAGIEEGRIAYANLRKVILLLVSTGAAEVLLMLLATLARLPPPLTAVQLLWLNLITNGMQDVALAFEKGEPGMLQRPARATRASFFDQRMIEQVALGGLAIGLTAFFYYRRALSAGVTQPAAQGAVLWLLVWCENAHCFNCRSETRSTFRIPPADNPTLITAIAATQLLQILALRVPVLRDLLSLQSLNIATGFALALAAVLVLAVMELYKRLRPAP